MKKVVKSAGLLLIIGILLVILTGCSGNKLVATRETNDEYMGPYKETVTIKFKNNKATSMEMIMEFDNEETAESVYNIYNLGITMSEEKESREIDIKQDGKKLIMTSNTKTFFGDNLSDEELSKDAIKTKLEQMGYTVK